MQSSKEQLGILQRIDQMMEELQWLRREVADMLVREAEATSITSDDTEVSVSPTTESASKTGSSISCISSLEELYALDFDQEEDRKEETPTEDSAVELLSTVEPDADLNELFMPLNSEEVLESAFEPSLHFDLLDHLTIADKFLFANELCFGNQADLIDMLGDIERLSSWSQVESYLYQVRGFKKEDEAVKQLAAFVKDNSK